MKSRLNLAATVILVALAVSAAETDCNARSYWIERGNDLFKQGNYTEAIKAYDSAIGLGNQIHMPIFNELFVRCSYRMNALDGYNNSHEFSNICAEPIIMNSMPISDLKGIFLSFDASNPNCMHMRISNIYVDVLKYNSTINPKCTRKLGTDFNRGYFCKIRPKSGCYNCEKTSEDYDFIDLDPKDIDHIELNVAADTPGVYQVIIGMDYAFGSEINSINILDAPLTIGFFNESMEQSLQ